MTTAVSALDQVSSRAARALNAPSEGGKGLVALLLAPVVLIVAAVLYSLLAGADNGGLLGTWAVLWFTAIGAIALAAGSLINGAFRTVDAVREAQVSVGI